MGRKKAEPKPTARQKNIFVLRGSDEFKEWLDGLATHLGTPVTGAVDRALREIAKREGYSVPPRRY